MASDDEKAGGDHTHLVSCSSRRRSRTEIPSSSSLDDLQEVLIEILLRLPTFKFAFQCKCVCKNWYSLLSSPYFARRFITHHSNHHYNQNPSALIINYFSKDHVYKLFTVSDEPMFKSSGFELNYLLQGKYRLVKVVALYKDLILCSYFCTHMEFRGCVCNPFTKEWVTLPLLQLDEASRTKRIGFICEPYYSEDSQGECTLNFNYRFRVIHINKVETDDVEDHRFILWTYRSENKKWCESVLQGSQYRICTRVVAHKKKLLWYNGRNIFAYDPFSPELSTLINCSYIHSTAVERHIRRYKYYIVGVCQGFLRMMQVVHRGETSRSFAVWELKDCARMEWTLVDTFYLDTESPIINTSKETSLAQELDGGCKYLGPLGFHPSDKNVVYFHCRDRVISYNMQARELKTVGEVPYKGYFCGSSCAFHIELPLWPTPIPQLIESLPC